MSLFYRERNFTFLALYERLILILFLFFSLSSVKLCLGNSLFGRKNSLTLYIDEHQVKQFSGFPMEIFAILDGTVLNYILDPNFERYLPVIPSDIERVNFTWRAGDEHKYYYEFNELKSFNETLLSDPLISIELKGKVPRRAKVFQILLKCLPKKNGVASFSIGLGIRNEKGSFLPGTPLMLKLKKQCADHGPDPECDRFCANGGRCNENKICLCQKGYMGKYCRSALCYPKCMNGGTCSSPGKCACSEGYHGPHCEGGMCSEKCLNGGKCIGKDLCRCRRGYYGLQCEYSKCSNVPCLNGGRCIGVNRCRCKQAYTGRQCETLIMDLKRHTNVSEGCKKKCVHGVCQQKQCICDQGWYGKKCSRRRPRHRRQKKLKH